jgi:1-acyl-sn-glycerol-3-phosphate acyltransferase
LDFVEPLTPFVPAYEICRTYRFAPVQRLEFVVVCGSLLITFPFHIHCDSTEILASNRTQADAGLVLPAIFHNWKKIRVEREFEMNPKGTYVFVANHFSYLDIAAGMGIFNNHFAFIGKSSVRKIPLLGYMFYRLHIMVDRSDRNSRSNSLNRGIKSLRSGRSVFVMPEGGVVSKNIPQMAHPFKDGAFIMAIENKVPIVPITFVNNYKIMPGFKLQWGTPEVVIHKAISTENKTKADINALREEVYGIIQKTIDENN